MKKEHLIIDTYIENVCKGIENRKIKREITDELYSHIMELYERNIALGMSDEDAQKDTVSHMGDSEAVSKTFRKLYPISTIKYLKQRALILIAPLLITALFSNQAFDILYLFSSLLFISLIDFRKINKYFNSAFALSITNFVLQITYFFLRSYFVFDMAINIAILILNHIAIIAIYTLILLGLIKIKRQLNEPAIDIKLAYISIPLITISNVIFIINRSFSNLFSFDFLGLIVNILPSAVIYTTVKSFVDIDFEAPQKKRYILLKSFVVYVLVFAMLIGVFFLETRRQPEVISYSVNSSQTEVIEIKENLIALGLPNNIANELPEDEILKYKNAINLEIVEKEIYEPDKFTTNLLEEQGDELIVREEPFYTAYAFHIKENENEQLKIRVLFVLGKFECFEELYRDEFFIETDHYSADLDLSDDMFCKFLCETDNKTVEYNPFYNGTLVDLLSKEKAKIYFYHFGFPNNAEKYRIYSAHTIIPTNEDENIVMFWGYNHSTSATEANNPYQTYWLRNDYTMRAIIENPIYEPTN